MDALQKAWLQFVEQFRRLSPNARLAVSVSAVALLLCIGWGTRNLLAVESVYLLGGQPLTTEQLTEMQSAMAKAQLNDFIVEGNRIRVPRERLPQYIEALAANGALPESIPDMFSDAVDKVNPLTNMQQQADFKEAARLKSLTSILRSFDGVETAEVVFDKSETRALRPTRMMTALVAIKLRAGRPLDDDRAAMFRSVLTASIAGLAAENVTVVDKTTNRSYHYQPDQASGGADRYRDSKRTYEAQYEARVRNVLQHVPGVVVSAEVELEYASNRQQGATTANPATAARPIQGAANQPLDLTATADAATAAAQMTTTTPTSAAHVPPREFARTDVGEFIPKRVFFSIGVPGDYLENIWRQRLAAPSEQRAAGAAAPDLAQVQTEELANIRQLVTPFAQAANTSADPSGLVTVAPLSTVTQETAAEPTWFATTTGWLFSPWGPLMTLLCVIAGAWIVRNFFHRAPVQAALIEKAEAHPGQHFGGDGRATRIDEPAAARPSAQFHERLAATSSLRDELADMVREDPDVAANILRSWIGNSNS